MIDFEGSGSCVDGHEQTLDMYRTLEDNDVKMI